MARDYNRVDNIDPKQINEPPKVYIVALSDAIRDERAMMVEHFDAVVARATMNRALRSEYHARVAELYASNVSFLTIEAVNHQVVLERASKLLGMCIFYLFRDEAGVRGGRLIHEEIDQYHQDQAKYQWKSILFFEKIGLPGEAQAHSVDAVNKQDHND